MKKQVNNFSLAHTMWNFKYHIVFDQNIGEKYFLIKKIRHRAILGSLCEWKEHR